MKDNPRRAILKARVPQFMQSCLCLTIVGVRYSAFFNFLLLRRPLKAQVFCHRFARMEQFTLDERFFACAEGSLLILAPWPDDLDAMPRQFGGDYDRFHNMNLLAEQICKMDVAHTDLTFRMVSEG